MKNIIKVLEKEEKEWDDRFKFGEEGVTFDNVDGGPATTTQLKIYNRERTINLLKALIEECVGKRVDEEKFEEGDDEELMKSHWRVGFNKSLDETITTYKNLINYYDL